MSNPVLITPCKMQDIDLNGNPIGETSWGIRVSDNEASTYCNTYDESQIVGATPDQIFALARDIDETSVGIIDFAVEAGSQILIADEEYSPHSPTFTA